MTTTTTRRDVLDALLAERIDRDWERAPTRQTFKEFCAPIVEAELEAMNGEGDFDAEYASLIQRHRHGHEVLRDWRLVQSEPFNMSTAISNLRMLQQLRAQGQCGYLLAVYGGYIPTSEHTRYVGLAPRQQDEA